MISDPTYLINSHFILFSALLLASTMGPALTVAIATFAHALTAIPEPTARSRPVPLHRVLMAVSSLSFCVIQS